MLYNPCKHLKNFFKLPELEREQEDFNQSVDRLNIKSGRVTALAFINIQLLLSVGMIVIKRGGMLVKPYFYYSMVYITIIIGMIIFAFLFSRLEKDIPRFHKVIHITGFLFMEFILSCCAMISLLDQLSNGEIIIYAVAVIAIAVTPLYRPLDLLLSYMLIHIPFLLLLPYFNTSGRHLYGECVNSTAIVMISWAISFMRYKYRMEDYLNRKKLQEKTEELEKVNQILEETNQKLQQANKKLEILSHTDSLTGISNRSVFDSILKKEWMHCKESKRYLSLIMIDIDYFKLYNDHYGHQAGDLCLRQVAEIISECVEHKFATVARYGGEEFAVILPSVDQKKAFQLAETIRASVEKKNIPHGYSTIADCVTISLGVNTIIPSEEQTLEALIKSADMALYQVKNKSRNEVSGVQG